MADLGLLFQAEVADQILKLVPDQDLDEVEWRDEAPSKSPFGRRPFDELCDS